MSTSYYIDIKTVGPNKAGFLDHKRLTLTWIARANKKIHSMNKNIKVSGKQ